jgi:hypothetical protein
MLNFRVQMGSGAFIAVWPLATMTPHQKLKQYDCAVQPRKKKAALSCGTRSFAEGLVPDSGVLPGHCERWTLFLALFPA